MNNQFINDSATSLLIEICCYIDMKESRYDSIRGNGYIEASELCPQFEKNLIACFFDNSWTEQ